MFVGLSFATFVVAITFFPPTGEPAPTGRVDEVIRLADEALGKDDPARAVETLEGGLSELPQERDPRLLEKLRQSYQRAADKAKAAGRNDDAEAYLENLEILKHAADRTKTAPPAPDRTRQKSDTPAIVEPSSEPARKKSEPEIIEPPLPQSRPEAKQVTRESLTPEIMLPPSSKAVEPPVSPLGEADRAFVSKHYDEAARIYAELFKKKKLPENRRDHWAYCRSVEVAQAINAQPSNAAEWANIDEEISKIRRLSPQSWVGPYLKKLADERSGGPRAAEPTRIRGSQGPSDELAAEQPMSPVPRQPVVPRPARPVDLSIPVSRAARADAPVGRWRVKETENFRIYHDNAELAEKVAVASERIRTVQATRWGGSAPRLWNPRCDVYLFPNGKAFAAATGQAETSPGFSTMGISEGRVNQRLINLRADHPTMVEAVLPHELTHVILADFFRDGQIPRWADEGIAVLSEPHDERMKRARDLVEPLRTGRLFKLEDLFRMDYPDGPEWDLYYAQSVSVTRFLVESGTHAQFLEFLHESRKHGVEVELKRIYKFQHLGDMKEKWVAHAKGLDAADLAATDRGVRVK